MRWPARDNVACTQGSTDIVAKKMYQFACGFNQGYHNMGQLHKNLGQKEVAIATMSHLSI